MKLTDKQLCAIESILDGDTRTRTAKLAGVSNRTIQRWMLNVDFQDALQSCTRTRFLTAGRRLAANLDEIVIDVLTVATDRRTAKKKRFGAMMQVLRLAFQYMGEIEAPHMVARLEQRLDAMGLATAENAGQSQAAHSLEVVKRKYDDEVRLRTELQVTVNKLQLELRRENRHGNRTTR